MKIIRIRDNNLAPTCILLKTALHLKASSSDASGDLFNASNALSKL